jgi:hypothetical protein
VELRLPGIRVTIQEPVAEELHLQVEEGEELHLQVSRG